MNSLFLHKTPENVSGKVQVSGSKSETNRLLILNQLYHQKIEILNSSTSQDSRLLKNALNSKNQEIDIRHAGTAMRFLTAYFAVQPGKKIVLTGSERMKERPIGILVEALNSLGADIQYLEKKGFPPVQVSGKNVTGDSVELKADVSSQFVTALMLIAPRLENGLEIILKGKTTSFPYLKMTLELLNQIGVETAFENQKMKIYPKKEIENQTFVVEPDWSSASYFYSAAAISKNADIELKNFKKESLQGDAGIVKIYREHFGVETEFSENKIRLTKNRDFKVQNHLELDLNDMPDIAQTLAVSCAALKIKCRLSGLETLKVKETDRLSALKTELEKTGAGTEITTNSLEITDFHEPLEKPLIHTYEDHRMAMAFAPFSLINAVEIENPEIVGKSYPEFWEDFQAVTQNF